jgi:hypothetical protein
MKIQIFTEHLWSDNLICGALFIFVVRPHHMRNHIDKLEIQICVAFMRGFYELCVDFLFKP